MVKAKIKGTKAVLPELPSKFVNIKDYAVENGIQDNSDKAGSLLKAINAIDKEYGIVNLFALGEFYVAEVRAAKER